MVSDVIFFKRVRLDFLGRKFGLIRGKFVAALAAESTVSLPWMPLRLETKVTERRMEDITVRRVRKSVTRVWKANYTTEKSTLFSYATQVTAQEKPLEVPKRKKYYNINIIYYFITVRLFHQVHHYRVFGFPLCRPSHRSGETFGGT